MSSFAALMPAAAPQEMTDAEISDMISEMMGTPADGRAAGKRPLHEAAGSLASGPSATSGPELPPGYSEEAAIPGALKASRRDRRQNPAATSGAGSSAQAATGSQRLAKKREWMAALARKLTGDPNATANDYKRELKTALARKLTGNPDAKVNDYDRASKAARARKLTGDPNATANDYQRIKDAERARKRTGDPNATAADYHRIKNAERAQKRTRNLDASGSGRAIVALSSMAEAASQNWNAGDRFSIPGLAGNPPQDFEVTRNRQGGEEVFRGDFRPILRGG